MDADFEADIYFSAIKLACLNPVGIVIGKIEEGVKQRGHNWEFCLKIVSTNGCFQSCLVSRFIVRSIDKDYLYKYLTVFSRTGHLL